MCPGGQQEMKEKVLPSFGGTQDHSGSTSATWHRGLTSYVFQRWAEGIMQRWLSLALLSHQCLPFEDGVMGLLPRHTPNLPSKTHFFSRKFTSDLPEIWQFTAWSLNKVVHVFANDHQYSSLGPLIHPDLPCFHIPAMPLELGTYQKTMNHLKHLLTHSVGALLTRSTKSNSQLLWNFFTHNICSHSQSHFCHLSEGHRPTQLEEKVSSCKSHRGTKDFPSTQEETGTHPWCLFLEFIFFFNGRGSLWLWVFVL